MMSVHTHCCSSALSNFWLPGFSFTIFGKGEFSLIADYSVIKLCFKIMCGKTIYHIVIHALKAFCFAGVITL